MFSVALSLGLLPVAVSHHRALTSSDFPPRMSSTRSGRLVRFAGGIVTAGPKNRGWLFCPVWNRPEKLCSELVAEVLVTGFDSAALGMKFLRRPIFKGQCRPLVARQAIR